MGSTNPCEKGSWGQHGAHLGPRGPMWAPCCPHEFCNLEHASNISLCFLKKFFSNTRVNRVTSIFSCDQAALQMVFSVCLSVRPCQFAADDILLYKFCYNIQWIYFTIWEKGKEELSPLQYHFKSFHINTLQEESAKKSNIPWIWRIIYGHKLPYMKKTKITLYEEDKKEEASMRCSLLHGSWDQILRRRPSVCLSVTPFWLCSHHRIIMKLSELITNDQSKVHAKGQGQRSKVKVTEVTTQLNRFRTVTPVWIHKWWWNDAYSLMLLRRGALLFFKVIRQISRSHGSKNRRIWPRLGVSGL